MSSNDESAEQAQLVEAAKERMKEDLAKVHIRGRLTNYYEKASGAFMVATASYALGNLEEILRDNNALEGNMARLIHEALEATKSLHFFSRLIPEVRTSGEAIRDNMGRRSATPGDPPSGE